MTFLSLTDLQQSLSTGEQEKPIIDYPISPYTVADLSSKWGLESRSASA
jgi:hypothetical protein